MLRVETAFRSILSAETKKRLTFSGTVCPRERSPTVTKRKGTRRRDGPWPTARPRTTRSSGRPRVVSTCFAAVADAAGPASGVVAVAVARAVAVAAWNPSPPKTRRQRPNDSETPASGVSMSSGRPKVRKIPGCRDSDGTKNTSWIQYKRIVDRTHKGWKNVKFRDFSALFSHAPFQNL